MKNLSYFLSILMLIGLVLFNSCEDDESPKFTLISLTAGDIDLAGATTANDVPEDAVITATFSSDIDASTVSETSISITADGSDVSYSLTVNGDVVTITPTYGWNGGTQYSIALSSTIMGLNGVMFEGNTLTFRTSGIFIPQKEKQVLYLSFDDESLTDETGMHTVSTVATVNFAEDRWGDANSAAYFDGQGGLVEIDDADDLITGQMTISFWLKSASADYDGADGASSPQTRFLFGLGNELGYFLELGRRSNNHTADGYSEFFFKMVSEHENNGTNATANPYATSWSEVNKDLSVGYVAGTSNGWNYVSDDLAGDATFIATELLDQWAHLAIVFDGAASTKTMYVNGVKVASFTWVTSGIDWALGNLALKPDVTGMDETLALGFTCSSATTSTSWLLYSDYLDNDPNQKKFFKGSIDQFRIFSTNLTDAEIASIYTNEQ